MNVGKRLRLLRDERKLTQRDIEKRTGLKACYTSRVENGVTIPAINTLEKYARALEIPLYQLFYNGPKPRMLRVSTAQSTTEWGANGKGREELRRFARVLSRLDERQRHILLEMARRMERKKNKRKQNKSGGTLQTP